MPLTIFMRPDDELRIDDEVRIRWVPIYSKGRRIKLLVAGQGHDVRLEKGKAAETDGNLGEGPLPDIDGNRPCGLHGARCPHHIPCTP